VSASTTASIDARAARLAEIVAGAEPRALLGQAATHTLLPDGTHTVQLYDRAAGRLLVGVGPTVTEAVANLNHERGGPQT
jgi:hypothetical protein